MPMVETMACRYFYTVYYPQLCQNGFVFCLARFLQVKLLYVRDREQAGSAWLKKPV